MDNKIVRIILSLFLSFFLSASRSGFLKKGAGQDLIINIVLCILFFVPGVIHALWVTLK